MDRWKKPKAVKVKKELFTAIFCQVKIFGGLYFVSDGNHRVSVAKYHGVEWIDAEVIELSFEANFKPGSTKQNSPPIIRLI